MGMAAGAGQPWRFVNGHLRDLLVGRTVERVEDIFDAWDALYYGVHPVRAQGDWGDGAERG